jgi:hypothetical protein
VIDPLNAIDPNGNSERQSRRLKLNCKSGNRTFLRRPEVPGFWPSIGVVSTRTTLNTTIFFLEKKHAHNHRKFREMLSCSAMEMEDVIYSEVMQSWTNEEGTSVSIFSSREMCVYETNLGDDVSAMKKARA